MMNSSQLDGCSTALSRLGCWRPWSKVAPTSVDATCAPVSPLRSQSMRSETLPNVENHNAFCAFPALDEHALCRLCFPLRAHVRAHAGTSRAELRLGLTSARARRRPRPLNLSPPNHRQTRAGARPGHSGCHGRPCNSAFSCSPRSFSPPPWR